jgi:hypothetical protein
MGIKEFFLKKAIWKGIRRGIQVVVAAAASEKLKQSGITIDETTMTAALTGLAEAGLNLLKVKYPGQFGWL